MPKTYDATMKHLLDNYSPDWIGWLAPELGLPATIRVKAVDPDLSIVQATADKVYQILNPEPCYLHLEAQTSPDPLMPDRMLRYNVLLENKFNSPVYSVLLLLRPQANSRSINGQVIRRYPSNKVYLRFRYKCIKVWQLAGQELLHGNLGTVPLAFLTNDARGHLEEWVHELDERAERESIPARTLREVKFLSSLLCGLRYDKEEILKAFHGVDTMKESTTYQHFFREAQEEGETKGRIEGELKGRIEGEFKGKLGTLINILNTRFGQVPPQLQARYQAVTDLATLDAAILKAITIKSLDELV